MFKFKFKTKISLKIFLAFIGIFITFRSALLLSCHDVFKTLPLKTIIFCFANGIRFDLAIIATFVMPFVFLLNLPLYSRKWIKTIIFATVT
ncbi:MAG: hypothetical protein LBG46_03480, partial [Elusimicrobiota bacterium]|nr:hypothetical protein [Elusimicrobiota bacterium]